MRWHQYRSRHPRPVRGEAKRLRCLRALCRARGGASITPATTRSYLGSEPGRNLVAEKLRLDRGRIVRLASRTTGARISKEIRPLISVDVLARWTTQRNRVAGGATSRFPP